MDNTKISLVSLCRRRWRSSIQSAKTRLRADCGSDREHLIAKFRLKLKKVGKTTRPFSSVQFSSVTQSCVTLCDPMNHSTPGLPVHHQLLEFTQMHFHWVRDGIQPSHPLSSPSPPAPNPSQHQGFFQWVNFSHCGQSIGVSASASVLPVNTQDWSPLGWTGW